MVPEPLDAALEVLDSALSDLLAAVAAGELAGVEDAALVGVLNRFERFRNRLSVMDHGLVGEVVARELPERLQPQTTRRLGRRPGGTRSVGAGARAVAGASPSALATHSCSDQTVTGTDARRSRTSGATSVPKSSMERIVLAWSTWLTCISKRSMPSCSCRATILSATRSG